MTRHTCRVGVPTHSDTHSCLMRSRDAAKTKMRLGSPSPLLNCSTDRAHLGSLVPNWTDRSGFAREYRVTLHTCSTQRVVHALHPTPAALHFWESLYFFQQQPYTTAHQSDFLLRTGIVAVPLMSHVARYLVAWQSQPIAVARSKACRRLAANGVPAVSPGNVGYGP